MSLVINSYLFPTKSWELKLSGLNIRNVAMSADGYIQYASSSGGNIYKSINRGSTWTQLPFSTEGNEIPIATSSSGRVVLTAGGSIFVSNDYGQNWSVRGVSDHRYVDVALSGDGQTQFALMRYSTANRGLYKSINEGLNWNKISSAPTADVFSLATSQNASIVYLSNYRNLYKSIDGGSTWEQKVNDTADCSFLSTSYDGQYVLSAQIFSYKSSDGGTTFSRIEGPTDFNFYTATSMSGNGKIQVALRDATEGRAGGINTSLDYGATWQKTGSLFNDFRSYDIKVSENGKYQTAIVNGDVYTNSNFGY